MIRTQEATGKTVDEARANACAKLGVKPDLQSPVALLLQLMGPLHPRADLSRGFSFLLLLQILIAHRRHIDADIYAIQQRAGTACQDTEPRPAGRIYSGSDRDNNRRNRDSWPPPA